MVNFFLKRSFILKQGFGVVALAVCLSLLTGSLSGCDTGHESLEGRQSGGGPDDGKQGDEKPKPVIVEALRPLLLQKPTLSEEHFLNVMQLKFGEADQAAFTFTFAPLRDGSLYFTNIQSRLHLEGCTKDAERVATFNVVWQEDLGTSRKRLKDFGADITEYLYEKGKKYMLTYALVNLKGELADCKSATLKFAAFDRNYSKSSE
jgi:hypothetical protein